MTGMKLDSVEVLLVEDNVHDAELTIEELTKNHLANELFHVSDGEEALDFLFATGAYTGQRSMQQFPKLIMLDIQMPKVNGIEVLTALKSDERTKMIPVVMLTSSREDPDIRECYRLGVNSYIVKPVNFERFAEAIKNMGFYWLLLNEPPV
jgi:two-component system, response regulator